MKNCKTYTIKHFGQSERQQNALHMSVCLSVGWSVRVVRVRVYISWCLLNFMLKFDDVFFYKIHTIS